MRKLAITLTAAALAVPVACSPANVGSPDDGPSVAQACTDSSYARCNRFQACSPVILQVRYGDEATCESLLDAFCTNSVTAPSSGSTPATVEACVQQIPSWACSDYVNDLNSPPACQQATGSLASGAACAFPAQCSSGFCAIAAGSACGVCAALPQAGDSCAQLTTCGAGLSCNSASSACATFALSGSSCALGQPCVSGNACEGASASVSGTCDLSAETLGTTCNPSGGGCDSTQGLSCNSQSKQCVALQLVGAGQPCGTVNDEGASCTNGGKCLGETTTPGTCTATAAVGAACDLSAGPGCISPSRCIVARDAGTAGTCLIPDATQCP
jgi:hypothetical protein